MRFINKKWEDVKKSKTSKEMYLSVAKEGCKCGGKFIEMTDPFEHHFLRCEKCKKDFYVTSM